MKAGDRVAWRAGSMLKQGTITGVRNDVAVIEELGKDGAKKLREVKLEKLTRLE